MGSPLSKTNDDKKGDFDALVLSGGGCKALGEAGALLELERRGVLQHIRKFAGTSAGTILCCMLVVGYTAAQIVETHCKLDMRNILDMDHSIIGITLSAAKHKGLCRGEWLLNYVRQLIGEKLGPENCDISFEDVYQLTGNEFIAAVTRGGSNGRLEYMSRFTTPTLPIAMAVRMSCSIPGVYAPFNWKGNDYVDGGVCDNYPLHIWNHEKPRLPNLSERISPRTLGIKLGDGHRNYLQLLENDDYPAVVPDIFTFLLDTLMIPMEQIELMRSTQPGYWEQTILVKPEGASALSVNMGRDRQEALLRRGQLASAHFMEARKPVQVRHL